MVKVVSTATLRETLDGLPPECYGDALDNPDGYFAHDVNPKDDGRKPKESGRTTGKGLEKEEDKD